MNSWGQFWFAILLTIALFGAGNLLTRYGHGTLAADISRWVDHAHHGRQLVLERLDILAAALGAQR